MRDGPAYLLIDRKGQPFDVQETLADAMAAADEWDPPGRIYLDAPTEQDYALIAASDTEQQELAANPPAGGSAAASGARALAAALKREGPRPIDYKRACAMSLRQAHRKLRRFFPTHKYTRAGDFMAVHYDEPAEMAQRFLGQNYKTEKETPNRIIKKLRAETGYSQANVLGLSLLPSTQSYAEPMVTEIMSKADTYGVRSVKPVRLNACVRATPQCASSCLAFSGRNLADNYNTVKKYALLQSLVHEPEAFVRMLTEAIALHRDQSFRSSVMPLVRLNVFSDIPWELVIPDLFDDFSDVQFYDYTKVPGRQPPPNYDLTFSFAGTKRNVEAMDAEIRRGSRVAMVFAATSVARLHEVEYKVGSATRRVRKREKKKIEAIATLHGTQTKALGEVEIPVRPAFRRRGPGGGDVEFAAGLPEEFLGLEVIDGDESDMRPYDPAPSIVGLRWKPPANQGVTLEEAHVFVVLVDLVHRGGGYYDAVVSKTARFDDVDYSKYAPSATD